MLPVALDRVAVDDGLIESVEIVVGVLDLQLDLAQRTAIASSVTGLGVGGSVGTSVGTNAVSDGPGSRPFRTEKSATAVTRWLRASICRWPGSARLGTTFLTAGMSYVSKPAVRGRPDGVALPLSACQG